MSKLLEGKTTVITGGAQGIGRATAELLYEHGARIVIADLNGEQAQQTAEEIAGEDGVGVACDVTQADQVEAAFDTAIEKFGSLDVVINNAGITRDATMRTMTEEAFDQVIAVHLKGAWNGTRLASLRMREQKSGTIINISSISGKVGMVGQTNYSSAKAGIVGLTKAAAKEMGHHGVRVNAVQPGLIRTAMTEAMPQRIFDEKLAEIPMQRAAEPSEVASVVLFYASDLSSYMTGTVAEVSGGRFM